ncbi:acyltransferase family protein [Streptomyces sp. NPDC085540]|uniref:acyltransferase family protein n=1 Tax=Streptomyces sp. NPDC085540 TaxID=3365730 RepID=UPI0037D39E2E
MASAAQRGTRLPSLTAIRFPLMFLVFVGHLVLILPFADLEVAEWYHQYVSWIGRFGLSCFFILGGFILTWIHREDDTPLQFWRRRLAKIVPLHWLTFAVAMLVFASDTTTVTGGIMSFLLVAAWSPDQHIFSAANAPSWSLTCFVFFYLIFPVLYRASARIKAQHLWWCAGAVTAVFISVTFVVRAVVPAQADMAPLAPASSVDAFYYIQVFPLTRLCEFVLGILLARIVQSGRWINIRPVWVLALLVIVYVVSLELPREFRLGASMVIPLALLVPSLAAADMRGDRTLLANPFMVKLGDMSYGFLLIHWPVMNFFFQYFGEERLYSVPFAIGVSAIDLTVSLALAWVLTVAVERPLARRLAPSRRKKPAAVAAAPATQPSAEPSPEPYSARGSSV